MTLVRLTHFRSFVQQTKLRSFIHWRVQITELNDELMSTEFKSSVGKNWSAYFSTIHLGHINIIKMCGFLELYMFEGQIKWMEFPHAHAVIALRGFPAISPFEYILAQRIKPINRAKVFFYLQICERKKERDGEWKRMFEWGSERNRGVNTERKLKMIFHRTQTNSSMDQSRLLVCVYDQISLVWLYRDECL